MPGAVRQARNSLVDVLNREHPNAVQSATSRATPPLMTDCRVPARIAREYTIHRTYAELPAAASAQHKYAYPGWY